MPKKNKSNFVCNNCGSISSSWSGKCLQCGEWNTITEQIDTLSVAGSSSTGRILSSQTLNQSIKSDNKRLVSGIKEIDDVLGGGIVAGSINLIAGQPGIGKSTILLQLANKIASQEATLYISGEESAHQIGLRAKRLGAASNKLNIVTSNSADDIAATIAEGNTKLVIVDSIQTLSCSAISSAAGTVSQITNSTQLITMAAKKSDTAVIIVGHVTKEGYIAGPKVLEHAVDVVLQLEGDRYGGFKLLRAIKNRFGSTSETGIFEMNESGLQPVKNPSAALLSERQVSDGSIVLATMEGTRPLLVEVQALVNRTSYGYPKRAASGFDLNRLNLLIAMLERRSKLKLAEYDVYINIVGGIQIKEPAADLAICLAIGSAAKGLQLNKNLVVFGEIGLSGEVRHVPYMERRLEESKKLGFEGAIGPRSSGSKKIAGLNSVTDVRSSLNQFLDKD
ncbi:DNA repair protein RadA [bacterium]|nr:DNA repair protein RadA [bacterium]